MKVTRLIEIIGNGEGIEVEFKESRRKLSSDVFDSVCAFLNTQGGHLFLGVNNKGEITGIEEGYIDGLIDNFVSCLNNPQKLNPTFYLVPAIYEYEGKQFCYLYVPQSSQVHTTRNRIFVRNADGDFDISENNILTSQLYIQKQQAYSENQIFKYIQESDLRKDLIADVRKRAYIIKPEHPWKNMNDMELLKSSQLYQKNYKTGDYGITLAGVLLFGKDEVISSILPHFKTDAILRVDNIDRYDDRDYVVTNLIESYQRLMAFCQKHLPDRFFLEKDQRISIRDHILREIIVNMLIHREYLDHYPASMVIEKGQLITENSNIPHFMGNIDPDDFSPYPKNPNICRLFKEIGLADELGSGVRNLFKYTKFYSGGKSPQLIEHSIFKVVIPLIDSDLYKGKNYVTDQDSDQETDKDTDQDKDNVLKVVMAIGTMKISSVQIMRKLKLRHNPTFRKNYLLPAIEGGFVEMTIPQKPHSKYQKYRLTEKGEERLMIEGLRD